MMKLKEQTKAARPARIFDFGGMHFVVYVSAKNELDLSNIKVTIPDQPSRNAEIIHQFTVLNKLRRRHLASADFAAAYEREVANRYLSLQPDEREVVFNLLHAEYSAL
jgi:hypothetical protein